MQYLRYGNFHPRLSRSSRENYVVREHILLPLFICDQDMNLLRAEKERNSERSEPLLVRDDEPSNLILVGLFSAIDFDRLRIEQLNQQKLSRCQKVIFMVVPRRWKVFFIVRKQLIRLNCARQSRNSAVVIRIYSLAQSIIRIEGASIAEKKTFKLCKTKNNIFIAQPIVQQSKQASQFQSF